jgi:hypothetical protein
MSHEYDYRCLVCTKIGYHFHYPTQDLELGGISSMLEGDCPHVGFFRSVEPFRALVPQAANMTLRVSLWDLDTRRHNFVIENLDRTLVASSSLQSLLFRQGSMDHHRSGLIVDPEWIDGEVARSWTSRCDGTYGSRCKYFPSLRVENSTTPRYVIDTKDNCIRQRE